MGIFFLKGLRNIHRKRRNAMTNVPGKQWGGSSQSQGLGDAALRHPRAELGTSLGHQFQPGNYWGRIAFGQGEQLGP